MASLSKVYVIISYRNEYIFFMREIFISYGMWTQFGRAKVNDHTMT